VSRIGSVKRGLGVERRRERARARVDSGEESGGIELEEIPVAQLSVRRAGFDNVEVGDAEKRQFGEFEQFDDVLAVGVSTGGNPLDLSRYLPLT